LLLAGSILLLLVAAALPSFERSQTRSKVAGMKANLRVVATALEAYRLDNPGYPIVTAAPFTWPEGRSFDGIEQFKVYPGPCLTSPVAYVPSRSSLLDEFRTSHAYSSRLPYEIMYLPSAIYRPPYLVANEFIYRAQVLRYGLFVLRSAGPDGYYQNMPGIQADYGQGGWNLASYDPTNGTFSYGDIYRSQRAPSEMHR